VQFMQSEKHYSKGPHPAARAESWKEPWWERETPNRFVAAFQAGRLLNQLNWDGQLRLLVGDPHDQAIDAIVTRLQLTSHELGGEAPNDFEERLQFRLSRWRKSLSSVSLAEAVESRLEETEAANPMDPDYPTSEELCVDLANGWVKHFIDDVRNLKKSLFGSHTESDRRERWAFSLGEYVDRGMRRHDVATFLNRAHWDDPPELEIRDCEPKHDDRDGIDLGGIEVGRHPPCHDSGAKTGQPVDLRVFRDGYVQGRFVNYHPAPGSILPASSWADTVCDLARRVDIGKALSEVLSPVQFGATCEDVINAVDGTDREVYSALCQVMKKTVRRKPWWWHSPEECVPPEYQGGALRGQKQELANWLRFKDPRTVDSKVKEGVLWGRRHGHDDFEVSFRSRERYERALRRKHPSEHERAVHAKNSAQGQTSTGSSQ
jgi:hypothetical protein